MQRNLRPTKQSAPEPEESLPHAPGPSLIPRTRPDTNLPMTQLPSLRRPSEIDTFLQFARRDGRIGGDGTESRFDAIVGVDGTGPIESSAFRANLDESWKFLAERSKFRIGEIRRQSEDADLLSGRADLLRFRSRRDQGRFENLTWGGVEYFRRLDAGRGGGDEGRRRRRLVRGKSSAGWCARMRGERSIRVGRRRGGSRMIGERSVGQRYGHSTLFFERIGKGIACAPRSRSSRRRRGRCGTVGRC